MTPRTPFGSGPGEVASVDVALALRRRAQSGNEPLRCDECGRWCQPARRVLITPDSHYYRETWETMCGRCVNREEAAARVRAKLARRRERRERLRSVLRRLVGKS